MPDIDEQTLAGCLGTATHGTGAEIGCMSTFVSALTFVDARGDLVVLVSDNESWMDSRGRQFFRGTRFLEEWERYRARNPNAKLACIDLVPNTTTQALERRDVLNIGGFGDSVFRLLRDFVMGRMTNDHWVGEIDSLEL